MPIGDIADGLAGRYGTAGVIGAVADAVDLGISGYDILNTAKDAYDNFMHVEEMALNASGYNATAADNRTRGYGGTVKPWGGGKRYKTGSGGTVMRAHTSGLTYKPGT